jgi:hypothetical protein
MTMKTKVCLTKCTSYEFSLVYESVKKTVDLLGGINHFVKPGEKILIKPNLLGAREPEPLRYNTSNYSEVNCQAGKRGRRDTSHRRQPGRRGKGYTARVG